MIYTQWSHTFAPVDNEGKHELGQWFTKIGKFKFAYKP